MTQRQLVILLSLSPGIGWKSIARIVARNEVLAREPDDFIKLSAASWVEEYRLGQKAAQNLEANRNALKQEALTLEEKLAALNVHLVTVLDPHFPVRIEAFDPDPPAVIFLHGNLRLLDQNTFCVLSSRKSMPAHLDLIEALTEKGVMSAEVLVTGHDTPEYQRSAVVPLRWGSPRILCLDRGLFPVLGENLKTEAFRAARLWRYEFDPKTDLAVTPFAPYAEFRGINNQIRDRLVASLSERLDFVIASPGGNMMKLAKMGLSAGRKVRISDLSPEYRALRELGAEVIA